MVRGTVVFFHDEDGYGFIENDGADDVFFHITDVPGPDPEKGDEFEFSTEESRRGIRAANISRI